VRDRPDMYKGAVSSSSRFSVVGPIEMGVWKGPGEWFTDVLPTDEILARHRSGWQYSLMVVRPSSWLNVMR